MILFPNGPEFGPCLPASPFNIAKFLDLLLCFGNCESLGPLTEIKSYPSLVEKRTLKQILIYFLYQCQDCLTKKKIPSLCKSFLANNFRQKKRMKRPLSAHFIVGYDSYTIDTVLKTPTKQELCLLYR